MAKKTDKKEEKRDETVAGYSGTLHEGKKPPANAGAGTVWSPLGVTKPTPITTGKQN